MALKWLRDQFKHLKIVLWAVVAVFILLVFVDWGSGRSSGRGGTDAAVRIGGRDVSEQEFLSELKDNEERARKVYGDRWEELRKQVDLATQTMQQIIQRELLLEEAREAGLRVSEPELQRTILEMPVFRRQDGSFVGPQVYERILRANRLSPEGFEARLADDLLLDKLKALVREGIWVSDEEVERAYRHDHESADFAAVFLRYEGFLSGVELGQGEAEAYYEAHREGFRRDEQRLIRYLVVETSTLRRLLPAEEGDLESYFEEHRDDYVESEQARARHVLIRVAPGASEADKAAAKARADQVAAAARSGADFAELARERSEDPGSKESGGDLGWFGRGRMGKEFEEAVFGAKPGDIIGPVESQFGYHVIKVEGYKPQRQQSFDEVRDQVRFRFLEGRAAAEAEVRAAALLRRLRSEKPETDEAWQAIADEDEAVSLNVSPPFGEGEAVPGAGDDTELAAQVFAAKEGAIGGSRPIARGWMVWQLKEIRPAGVAPFADVEQQVGLQLRRSKALEVALARGAELAQSWRQGADPEGLATEAGTSLIRASGHSRGQSIERIGAAAAVDDALFAAQEGEVVGPLAVAERGAVIVRVERLNLVDPARLAAELDTKREELAEQRAGQLLGAILSERRRETVITVNNELLERFSSRG